MLKCDIFFQIDNHWTATIAHFKITNHRTIFVVKLSIHIQIVDRLAYIYRLSIWSMDVPTITKELICLPTHKWIFAWGVSQESVAWLWWSRGGSWGVAAGTALRTSNGKVGHLQQKIKSEAEKSSSEIGICLTQQMILFHNGSTIKRWNCRGLKVVSLWRLSRGSE